MVIQIKEKVELTKKGGGHGFVIFLLSVDVLVSCATDACKASRSV